MKRFFVRNDCSRKKKNIHCTGTGIYYQLLAKCVKMMTFITTKWLQRVVCASGEIVNREPQQLQRTVPVNERWPTKFGTA